MLGVSYRLTTSYLSRALRKFLRSHVSIGMDTVGLVPETTRVKSSTVDMMLFDYVLRGKIAFGNKN